MRLGTVAILAFACAAALPQPTWAADASSAAAPAPTDDSLATAKRELDQLKRAAAAGSFDNGSGALPSVAIPQVHADDEPVLITPPRDPTKLKPKQPSANWLVDGVMQAKRDADKSTDRSGPDRRRTRDTDLLSGDKSDPRSSGDTDKAFDPEKLADSPKNADAPPSARPDTVFNPLSQYMASWMTAQDYSMLRSGLDKPAGSPTDAVATPPAAGPDSGGLSALAGMGGGSLAAPRTGGYSAVAPPDNPFLGGLSLPDAPPTTNVASATPPAVLPPPPLVSPPPPPQQPEHSTIPDFAKPSDDDKYFKPLKRF